MKDTMINTMMIDITIIIININEIFIIFTGYSHWKMHKISGFFFIMYLLLLLISEDPAVSFVSV